MDVSFQKAKEDSLLPKQDLQTCFMEHMHVSLPSNLLSFK